MTRKRLFLGLLPLELVLLLAAHLITSLGESWLAIQHHGEPGYLLVLLGNALLIGLILYKAIRKHLLTELFSDKRPRGEVLFAICPLGLSMAMLAYALKTAGLMLLGLIHGEPAYLLLMLGEVSLVGLTAYRILHPRKPGRRRVLRSRLDLTAGTLPLPGIDAEKLSSPALSQDGPA